VTKFEMALKIFSEILKTLYESGNEGCNPILNLFTLSWDHVTSIIGIEQWCSNRGLRATCGPQGPLEWPAKQFALERKPNTLII